MGNRIGYNDQGCTVDGRLDIRMVAENLLKGGGIGNIRLVEDTPAGEFDPPGDQRIEDDGGVPVVFQS
jgi:hypothetical protein